MQGTRTPLSNPNVRLRQSAALSADIFQCYCLSSVYCIDGFRGQECTQTESSIIKGEVRMCYVYMESVWYRASASDSTMELDR